jgi:hypothetical protein
MFAVMPADVAAVAARFRAQHPAPAPIQAWAPPRRQDAPIVPRLRDPRRDVREFAAIAPHVLRMQAQAAPEERAWWEDPIALGTLLIVMPPLGLVCVWASNRYSNDARWALTMMSIILTCIAGAIALALLFAR